MNTKYMLVAMGLGAFMCANVDAMRSLPLKVSGIARRATTEGSQAGRAALLASVRANQGAGLHAASLSRGFASSSYDPKVRNKTVGWLKEALPRMQDNVVVDNKTGIGLQMMIDWLQERDELVRRYDELQKAEQGSANVEELNTVTRRLKNGDEKLDELLHELSYSESRLRELNSQDGELAKLLMLGGCELLLNTVYYGGVFMVGLFILGSLRR